MASGREYVTLSDVLVEYAPNRAGFYAGIAIANEGMAISVSAAGDGVADNVVQICGKTLQ